MHSFSGMFIYILCSLFPFTFVQMLGKYTWKSVRQVGYLRTSCQDARSIKALYYTTYCYDAVGYSTSDVTPGAL